MADALSGRLQLHRETELSGYRLPRRKPTPSKRIALLIGVKDYPAPHDLQTPLEDLRVVGAALEARSFTCRRLENPTQDELVTALEVFTTENKDAEHAVIYFSGHGFEHAGHGAVLPRDFPFPPNGENLHYNAMSVRELEEAFRDCGGVGVLVLDACRVTLSGSDADRWTQIGVRGGQLVGDQSRLVVAWSTSAGASAYDGSGPTSRYSAAFADAVRDHTINLDTAFARIGREVDAGTQVQHPWIKSGLRSAAAWTDLPQFGQPTIVQTPLSNINHGPLTLTRDAAGHRLLITGRNRALWSITAPHAERTRAVLLENLALAGDILPDGLVVAEETTGARRFRRNGTSTTCALEEDCYGMRAAPDGTSALAYGGKWLSILDLSGEVAVIASHHALPFYPYGAAFEDNQTAWLVVSDGAVARIDIPSGDLVEVTQRSPYVGNLYDVAVLEDGDLVITGGRGSVRRCRPEAGHPSLLTRHTNIDYSGFVRVPDADALRLRELWLKRCGDEDVLFCDVSPDGPLVAVGLAGGDVLGLDVRDGAPAGNWPSRLDDISLQGVAFAGDGTLAVLHGDGAVTMARLI